MAKAYVPSQFRTYCRNPQCYIQHTPKNIENMAYRLMRYLVSQELFADSRIYFKKKDTWCAMQLNEPQTTPNSEKIVHNNGNKSYELWLIKDINPNDYFEWNGDVLSMSFEGPLYHILNMTEWLDKHSYVREQLRNFFSTYGLYYELGDAWNFSVYNV